MAAGDGGGQWVDRMFPAPVDHGIARPDRATCACAAAPTRPNPASGERARVRGRRPGGGAGYEEAPRLGLTVTRDVKLGPNPRGCVDHLQAMRDAGTEAIDYGCYGYATFHLPRRPPSSAGTRPA